jgi:hypothetical protein
MEASSAAHALDEAGPEAAHAAHVPERETEEEQLPDPDAIEQASLESPAALLEGTRAGEPSAKHASKPDSPAQRTRKPLPRELAMLQADGEEPLCTQPACSTCPSVGVGQSCRPPATGRLGLHLHCAYMESNQDLPQPCQMTCCSGMSSY